MDNIYVWVFSINSESVLLLALVKYMLCSHFTQNCIFLYFLEAKNPCFVTKNCWKSSYICVFLSKKRCNWFHRNLHNSRMVGRRKLPDPLLNRIFNVLSLSFQWTNFGLKCLTELKILNVYQINILQHLLFMFKVKNSITPRVFNQAFSLIDHLYPTRFSDNRLKVCISI